MSLITINCSIDLTEEELLFVLRRRAGQIIMVSPPEETTTAASVGPILTPEQIADIAREEAELAAAHASIDVAEPVVQAPVEPPPLPPKQPRGRASRVNGAAAGGEVNSTPIASPPVNRLDEASMRALLSKVGAVHPLKVKAITNILEEVGGRRRLSECDPATWPAIAEEAQKILAEYGA